MSEARARDRFAAAIGAATLTITSTTSPLGFQEFFASGVVVDEPRLLNQSFSASETLNRAVVHPASVPA